MKTNHTAARSTQRGFISAKTAIVLAVIVGTAGLLTYEWHHAHPAKQHHSAVQAHHAHKHKTKTTASN
jgi:predicted negative regulator of RcsB-dependent stress response